MGPIICRPSASSRRILSICVVSVSIRTSSPFLPVIEDSHSSGLDPDLRYVEAATHIGVDGSKDHGILHQTFMPSGSSANGVTVAQRSAKRIEQRGKRKANDCLSHRFSMCLCSLLFDHLIRSHQHVRRDCQAQLLRFLKIDDEFELHGLLHGEITGLDTLQNLVDVNSSAPKQVVNARAVKHEATSVDIVALRIRCRQAVLGREVCDLCSMRTGEGGSLNEDCASMPFACGLECDLNILGI